MAPHLSEEEIDDLNYFSRAGDTGDLVELLSTIAARENVAVVDVLLAAKDEAKATCLHKATGNGHIETVRTILEYFDSRAKEDKQVFVDAANEFGNTSMHWAALGGHLDMVKLLVEHGASPALANDRNYVPLDLAGFNDNTAVVDYFLSTMSMEDDDNQDGLAEAVERVKLDGDDAGDDAEVQERNRAGG